MTKNAVSRPAEGRILTSTEEALLALQPMLENVPRIDEGSMEDILLQIARGETIEDVFMRSGAPSLQNWKDVSLRIDAIRWGQGDFEDGFPVVIYVDAVDGTGQKVVASTSSGVQVAQLIRAHALGHIPGLTVIPRRAEKATRNGFYPWRLELVVG